MNNGHGSKNVRNFFYTIWCVMTSAAFVTACYALYYAPKSKDVMLIVCISIIIMSLVLGVITPLFKTIFKR